MLEEGRLLQFGIITSVIRMEHSQHRLGSEAAVGCIHLNGRASQLDGNPWESIRSVSGLPRPLAVADALRRRSRVVYGEGGAVRARVVQLVGLGLDGGVASMDVYLRLAEATRTCVLTPDLPGWSEDRIGLNAPDVGISSAFVYGGLAEPVDDMVESELVHSRGVAYTRSGARSPRPLLQVSADIVVLDPKTGIGWTSFSQPVGCFQEL